MSRAIDLIITYRVVKMLVTPFTKFKAYELGIIDEKGNEVNSKSTAWNGKFWDGSTPYIELFKTNIDGHPWGTLLKVSSTERFGLRFIWY
mgnify:CR=1 FL=1